MDPTETPASGENPDTAPPRERSQGKRPRGNHWRQQKGLLCGVDSGLGKPANEEGTKTSATRINWGKHPTMSKLVDMCVCVCVCGL